MGQPGTPAAFDVQKLIADIGAAVNGVVQKDLTTYEAYIQRQTQGIAQQAQWIAESFVAQMIDADTRDFFLKQLADTTVVFAKTLAGLAMITVEKVWNAVVGVVWKSINAAIGAALPIPPLPAQLGA